MAAAVQEDDVVRPHVFQRGEEGGGIDDAFFAIVVGIAVHAKTAGAEDGVMVAPGGVGRPEAFAGSDGTQHFGDDTQCAGAGNGLVGTGAVGVVFVAEDERGHVLVEGLQAIDADVFFGGLPLPDALFGGLDGTHHRGFARGVLEDADADVDFFRARVVAAELGELEDRVVWQFFDGFKHGFSFFSWGMGRGCPAAGRVACGRGGRRGCGRLCPGRATIARFRPGRK